MFPTVQAPRQARRHVASLAPLITEESLADVMTVISELVGISVAHGAREPIEITVALEGGSLEGYLQDGGPGVRAIVRARSHADDSLVLQIFEALVDDWGTGAGEREIWFRMGVQPATVDGVSSSSRS